MTTATAGLAFDPAVPQRDLLLDTDDVAARLERLLHARVGACDVELARYRPGRRVVVLYRARLDGVENRVAVRTFATPVAAESAAREAAATARGRERWLPAAADPELCAAFWTFPHDRRIRGLHAISRRGHTVVRYLPERLAVARVGDDPAEPVAYAKAYADDEAGRVARIQRVLADQLGRNDPFVRVPAVLAHDAARHLVMSEAIRGRQLAELRGDALVDGMRRLGSALARLHMLRPPVPLRLRVRDDDELRGLAETVATLRPDAALVARGLHAALSARRPRVEPVVCLHYDASVRNALVDAERLALIDFDDVAVGPPAVDLGRVLSRLAGDRVTGAVSDDEHDRLRDAVLAGYGELRNVPPAAELRWHTAAATLVVRSRAAIGALKPQSGARLADLLDDARRLVT